MRDIGVGRADEVLGSNKGSVRSTKGRGVQGTPRGKEQVSKEEEREECGVGAPSRKTGRVGWFEEAGKARQKGDGEIGRKGEEQNRGYNQKMQEPKERGTYSPKHTTEDEAADEQGASNHKQFTEGTFCSCCLWVIRVIQVTNS